MKSILSVSKQEFDAQALEEKTLENACVLFREHGALWLQNVFPGPFIETLADAYAFKYTSQSFEKLKKKHAVVGDQRCMITVTIESPFNSAELYANPLLLPILNRLLGDDCTISSFGSVVAFPGAESQPIHFDHPPLFESEEQCVALPPYAITMVVPLVDIRPETGSTAIWEGSHAQTDAREQLRVLSNYPSWAGSTHPLPKLGDVYLMDYRVIHGGMANQSDQPRPILYFVYSRPWFRDAFNFRDQPPIEFGSREFKKVPKQHRGLFASHQSK